MPRRRIRFTEAVKRAIAQDPKAGPQSIRDELVRSLGELRRIHGDPGIVADDLPSTATIGRIKRDLAGAELGELSPVRWPQSFEQGYLPWEASKAVMELLHYCAEHGFSRPTHREGVWFWRISVARPDAAVAQRLTAAKILGYWWGSSPTDRDERSAEAVEAFLIYEDPLKLEDFWGAKEREYEEDILADLEARREAKTKG